MILRVLLRGMDRVQSTLCLMTEFVSCCLRQPHVPCCSVLPKYENESENSSPRSLLTFHVFAKLSRLIEVRQDVCCSYLNSSYQHTLFSFLKWREKDHNGKKLTRKLLTESGSSWRLEPTSPTPRTPTCHIATFSCFLDWVTNRKRVKWRPAPTKPHANLPHRHLFMFSRLHHPQTRQNCTILTSSEVNQKDIPS